MTTRDEAVNAAAEAFAQVLRDMRRRGALPATRRPTTATPAQVGHDRAA